MAPVAGYNPTFAAARLGGFRGRSAPCRFHQFEDAYGARWTVVMNNPTIQAGYQCGDDGPEGHTAVFERSSENRIWA